MIYGHNFTFIHIMKTGGRWVDAALEHMPPRVLWKKTHHPYSKLTLEEAARPTYAIIRNPWDWHVSMYHYMNARARREPNMYAPHKELYTKSFEEVLTDEKTNYRYDLSRHVDEMALRDDSYSQIKWRKYEDGLLPFFKEMVEGNGPPIPQQTMQKIEGMARVNTSKHKHYSTYYTPELKQLVAEREGKILRRFGYTFEGSRP